MNASLLYQFTVWVNSGALILFFVIELFWFLKERKRLKNIPSLIAGFFIYNLPFLLMMVSMYFQTVPEGWIAVLRPIVLLICVPINLWLHYHGDKGGNSVGMAIIFFLLAAVPLVIITEIFIGFYN